MTHTAEVDAAAGGAAKLPPQAALMGVAMGFIPAQSLRVAAKLRVADALANGPLPAAEVGAVEQARQRG